MNPLIVEVAPQEALYQYPQYRYWSLHIETDELDGMLAILRVWVTDEACHTFLVDPDAYDPPCTDRKAFWNRLLEHVAENRFVVHGESE